MCWIFSISIPNLQEGDQAPCIPVYGRSLLPHCHFDLEDSDYISRICCNPELRGPLDPYTRVIEFNTIGLSLPSTRYQRYRVMRGFYVHQWESKHFKTGMCILGLLHRCFSVLNPTSKLYSFNWKCEDTGGSPFRCLTPCGTILPGKKVEVRVEAYTVNSLYGMVLTFVSLFHSVSCFTSFFQPCPLFFQIISVLYLLKQAFAICDVVMSLCVCVCAGPFWICSWTDGCGAVALELCDRNSITVHPLPVCGHN